MLSTGSEGENLMFGYQKMGDYLMAYIFAHNKMSDEAKIDFILDKGDKAQYPGYKRFIVALLSEWNLTQKLLEKNSPKLSNIIPQILT